MDWELIFWVVFGIIGAVFLVCVFLPWNEEFCRKEDPYRYCPKGEE